MVTDRRRNSLCATDLNCFRQVRQDKMKVFSMAADYYYFPHENRSKQFKVRSEREKLENLESPVEIQSITHICHQRLLTTKT